MAFIEMFIAMARYCKTITAGDTAASLRAGSIAVAAARISQIALGETTMVRIVDADIEAKRQQY